MCGASTGYGRGEARHISGQSIQAGFSRQRHVDWRAASDHAAEGVPGNGGFHAVRDPKVWQRGALVVRLRPRGADDHRGETVREKVRGNCLQGQHDGPLALSGQGFQRPYHHSGNRFQSGDRVGGLQELAEGMLQWMSHQGSPVPRRKQQSPRSQGGIRRWTQQARLQGSCAAAFRHACSGPLERAHLKGLSVPRALVAATILVQRA
mmetsp:Transcript_112297/g.317410  ORF Transcript_112297/g.317410 Transcript_112297/m.317410 type:complete len:207 (-) Transcript_112297:669-1289(-)